MGDHVVSMGRQRLLKRSAIHALRSVIVSGYSGRDASVMDALRSAYAEAGTGRLYWCGFGEEIPAHVQEPSESPATAGLSSSGTHALITACQRCCQHEPTRKIIVPLR
jgi:hypothetical protein